jgi:hypothetical protein
MEWFAHGNGYCNAPPADEPNPMEVPTSPEVRARALREAQRVLDEHTVEALRDYPNLANLFVWFRSTDRRGP